MYLLVLYFPLATIILLFGFGRYFGKNGSAIISTLNCLLSLGCALYIFIEVGLAHSICYVQTIRWFSIGILEVCWEFIFDPLTAVMLLVVLVISTLVHIYSIEYMKEDPFLIRFLSFLSLFTVFMLLLVTAKNFVQLFLGWEGVGIASYLLISFWFTRQKAVKAALKAIIVNRIGDLGLLLGIGIIFTMYKSLDFMFLYVMYPTKIHENFILLGYNIRFIVIINLCLFIGVIGKSAQLGLHTWLPDAMEGPTPVSALIHAATMVTAGVFVLLRCSPLFELTKEVLTLVMLIGGFTAIFGAIVGTVQHDLKKVIAYSTCSQLGYMVFACGSSNYAGGAYHLANHAVFKALLFLSAGAVIHALSDEQDIRKMGGLLKIIPFTYVCISIGSFALMGIPYLSGFYSKDFILEGIFAQYKIESIFIYWLGSSAAFFTSFYSLRLIYLVFFGCYNGFKGKITAIHEPGLWISMPLFLLSFFSIFIGFILKDILIGAGTDFWLTSLSGPLIETKINFETEYLPYNVKLVPIICSFLGFGIGIILMKLMKGMSSLIFIQGQTNIIWINQYKFISKKFCIDDLYNNYIVLKILTMGYKITFKTVDRGILEIIGPLGIVRVVTQVAALINRLFNGQLGFYLSFIFYGLLTFLFGLNLY
jgi:NADH-ubiquinone oxidoreductase chain 5